MTPQRAMAVGFEFFVPLNIGRQDLLANVP
jgi:hypothetical protein